MATKSSDVSGGRRSKCFGVLYDRGEHACAICDFRVECEQETKGAGPMAKRDEKVVGVPVESPVVAEAGTEVPEVETPAVKEATVKEPRKAVEAPAFEPLDIRANTAGAYAIHLLKEGWYNPRALQEAVKTACGGLGTKAFDMLHRLKKAELLEVRGEGRAKEYHLKT